MRSGGCQDRRVAPRKVGRAQGVTRAFVKLFGQPAIRRSILGSDIDEPVCERFDCACEVRVLRAIRGVASGVNAGFKLTEKVERGARHINTADGIPRQERVI